MPDLNRIFVVLCYSVNFIFADPNIPINLVSLLSNHTPCRYHLISNDISTSNLTTTRTIPVTLTKRSFTQSDHTPLKLDVYQNKGWLCETVILFVSLRSPHFTNSDAKSLGNWIHTQTKYYLILNKEIRNVDPINPNFSHFIFIPSNYRILEFHSSALCRQPYWPHSWLRVKLAVFLFLPENRVATCYQKSIPILRHFACTTTLPNDFTSLFTPPTELEQHWVDYSDGKDAVSEILFSAALNRLNATRHNPHLTIADMFVTDPLKPNNKKSIRHNFWSRS